MSKYTTDDFMDEDIDIERKAHICLHLIKDYEIQVQIPHLSMDEYPLDRLEFHAYSSTLQSQHFDRRYTTILEDAETGEPVQATCGPLVLCGLYEGFLFLLSGHDVGAVPTEAVGAYGSMLVASARPYFHLLSGCEL